MNIANSRAAIVATACLLSLSCEKKAGETTNSPVRIIATDTGFEAPDRVAPGLRHLLFENRGTEIHEAMLVKLPDGVSAADFVAAVKGGALFPKGAVDYSGPGLTSPGESIEIWVSVDPGHYILVCWNSGHATSTAVHPFSVKGTRSDDAPPKHDVVVKLVDFRFEIEGQLRRGSQAIRVETPGPAMHEVDLYRLHEGQTVAELKRWRKEKSGPAPAIALGGALDSHDLSRVVWLRRDFSPGRYVLHCEMPVDSDASANSPHLSHADVGMVREIEITKLTNSARLAAFVFALYLHRQQTLDHLGERALVFMQRLFVSAAENDVGDCFRHLNIRDALDARIFLAR